MTDSCLTAGRVVKFLLPPDKNRLCRLFNHHCNPFDVELVSSPHFSLIPQRFIQLPRPQQDVAQSSPLIGLQLCKPFRIPDHANLLDSFDVRLGLKTFDHFFFGIQTPWCTLKDTASEHEQVRYQLYGACGELC